MYISGNRVFLLLKITEEIKLRDGNSDEAQTSSAHI